jgi:ribosomal protein S18 acetylase RimI-like enzyme
MVSANLSLGGAGVQIARLRVRHLEEADLPGLEWGGEFTHFRRMYADIFESSRYDRSVLWVADLPEAKVIGQLFVQLLSGRPELANGFSRGYIYGFRVQSRYRNHGIGARMMQVAEADLYHRNYHWVTLNVGKDNPRARALYERLGYYVVASEVGEWSYLDDKGIRVDVHEPAWRMEKRLHGPVKVNKE